MSDLLSDIDASIGAWWNYYLLCNTVLVAAGVVVLIFPFLTAANAIRREWGFLSTAGAVVLAWLGLGGVSANFIQARSDLQVAKYHYDISQKDKQAQEQLIEDYAKAKRLAQWVPSIPSLPGKEPLKPL